MDVCETCGSVLVPNGSYSSTTNLYKKDTEKSSSWFCFGRLCNKQDDNDSESIEVATSGDIPKNGIYQRRRTIMFDLDASTPIPTGTKYKAQSSILKTISKVFIFLAVHFRVSSQCKAFSLSWRLCQVFQDFTCK